MAHLLIDTVKTDAGKNSFPSAGMMYGGAKSTRIHYSNLKPCRMAWCG